MTDEEVNIILREFSWDGHDMAREIASLRAGVQRERGHKQALQRTVVWLIGDRRKVQRDLDAAVGYKLAESGE